MKKIELTINVPAGLHARTGMILEHTAKMFRSRIQITKGEKTANAKNIIEIMSLKGRYQDVITIVAEGDDEEAALEAIKKNLQGS